MASTAPNARRFPEPVLDRDPPGCEGWEEMYPYYALFDERRRENDENRFWFWNSMHFPMPMPAFDVICIDSPYQAVGSWQNRVFAVPPAMGIDYRVVNGYIYISGNPVTDPAKIAERAGFFQKRAGYYFQNWTELYGKWRAKMEALIAELGELRVPDLPEYEPDEVAFGEDRNTAFYEVLDAYGRALRLGDLMWQHHFEFLLLGYGAYATFAELCKGHLPDIPTSTSRRWSPGSTCSCSGPTPSCAGWRGWRSRPASTAPSPQGRTPREIDAELAQSDAGPRWLAELEKVKDPWFNMATGDGLYHYYRSWLDDPSIPYASLIGHVSALKAGEQIDRPTEEIERERDRLAQEYGALLDEESRGPSTICWPLAHGVPLRRGAQVLLRLLVPDPVVEQDPRVRRAAGSHGFLEDGEDVFQLSRYEVAIALDELVLTWATGGRPLGPKHWPPIVARRKEILERLAEWTPPPALGVTPEAVTDPMTIMLWGVTTERVQEWARHQDGGRELNGAAASPGVVEGIARVVRSVNEIARRPRRRDPRLRQHVPGVGADLLQDQGHGDRCRRGDVARGDRVSRVRAARGRRNRPRHLGRSAPGRRSGSTAPTGVVTLLTVTRIRAAGRTAPLGELRRDDEPRFGGKSASLGELLAAGIPVPPGFALSTAAFDAFIDEAGLQPTTSALAALDRRRRRDRPAPTISARSRGAVPDGRAGRTSALRRAAGAPVAVRSSAIGEDSAEATFAGQQETYLWVRGAEGVFGAVRDCWASLYSPTGDQLPRPAGRTTGPGDGSDRPADGRRRGLGRDVHLQPGQRRSQHGRHQRQLGTRPGRRRRRGDPRRLSAQQGHRRGRAQARRTPRTIEHVPAPTAAEPSRRRLGANAASAPCLDAPTWPRCSTSPAGSSATSAPPGHRMGNRPRRRRRTLRPPIPPRHRPRQAAREAQAARPRCHWS